MFKLTKIANRYGWTYGRIDSYYRKAPLIKLTCFQCHCPVDCWCPDLLLLPWCIQCLHFYDRYAFNSLGLYVRQSVRNVMEKCDFLGCYLRQAAKRFIFNFYFFFNFENLLYNTLCPFVHFMILLCWMLLSSLFPSKWIKTKFGTFALSFLWRLSSLFVC